MTKAWHLRQDGKAFPIIVHLYPMGDADLASEAEVAAFLVKTNSKDLDLANYVLDAWMAMLIEDKINFDATEEDIDNAITSAVSSTPYRFAYPLSAQELLEIHSERHAYNDVDGLYDFIDSVRDNLSTIQSRIKMSFNQQFCRVRYGGKYNSASGNNGIWFRIASAGYNWANTIYVWVTENRRSLKLETITICRDAESDDEYGEGEIEYFYKAKDGAVYENMPIDEFLNEEHEHSLVFSSTSVPIGSGIRRYVRNELKNGDTFESYIGVISGSHFSSFVRPFIKQEIRRNCVDSGPAIVR